MGWAVTNKIFFQHKSHTLQVRELKPPTPLTMVRISLHNLCMEHNSGMRVW